MPPWFERDNHSDQPQEHIIKGIISHPDSRVMLIPRADGRLRLCFPGIVETWIRQSNGSVKMTEIHPHVDLQPGVHVKATVVPPQGEKITVFWESDGKEKEDLINDEIQAKLSFLKGQTYHPCASTFCLHAEFLRHKSAKTARNYLKIIATEVITIPLVYCLETMRSLPKRIKDKQSGRWLKEEQRLRQDCAK